MNTFYPVFAQGPLFLIKFLLSPWVVFVNLSVNKSDPAYSFVHGFIKQHCVFTNTVFGSNEYASGLCLCRYGALFVSHADEPTSDWKPSVSRMRVYLCMLRSKWKATRRAIEAARTGVVLTEDDNGQDANEISDDCASYLYRDRTGGYKQRRLVMQSNRTPTPAQARIVEDIRDVYSRLKRVCVFLSGPPCTGKTTLGLFLARAMNACYIDDFDPCATRSDFNDLYASASPSYAKPLIVCIDEADVMLESVFSPDKSKRREMRDFIDENKLVRDKRTYNLWMDRIQSRFVHVVLLMTSNRPKAFMDSLDPCILAPHRVNMCVELTQQLIGYQQQATSLTCLQTSGCSRVVTLKKEGETKETADCAFMDDTVGVSTRNGDGATGRRMEAPSQCEIDMLMRRAEEMITRHDNGIGKTFDLPSSGDRGLLFEERHDESQDGNMQARSRET